MNSENEEEQRLNIIAYVCPMETQSFLFYQEQPNEQKWPKLKVQELSSS